MIPLASSISTGTIFLSLINMLIDHHNRIVILFDLLFDGAISKGS